MTTLAIAFGGVILVLLSAVLEYQDLRPEWFPLPIECAILAGMLTALTGAAELLT